MRAMHPRMATALALVVVIAPLLSGAHPGSTDTALELNLGTGTIELSPGLCLPGDTPSCVGPYAAQFHLVFPNCRANGLLEGALLADASCSTDNAGFTVGTIQGVTKPSCANAHTYTSAEATVFGVPVINNVVINGLVRNTQVSYVTRPFGTIVASGWMDDDDADDDPVGDHTLVAILQLRLPSAQEGIPCVTTPVTTAPVSGVSHAV